MLRRRTWRRRIWPVPSRRLRNCTVLRRCCGRSWNGATPFALRDLAIGGEELLALGYRGKAIGGALDALLSGVIAGEAENDRAALLHYLAALNLPKSE